MARLLSTYIFKEIFVPFILSMVILTVTVLLTRTLELIDLIVGHGVGPGYILWLIIAMMPTFLTTITPIAFLIAVLIAYARLSSENEIIAMKASGINIQTHLKPVMLFATAIFIVLLAITTHLTAWGNNYVKEIMYDVARTKTTAGIKEQTFYNRYEGVVLYVDHIPTGGPTMQGVFISERDPGRGETLIFAKRGKFIPSPEDLSVTLSLEDGSMQIPKKSSQGDDELSAPFDIVNFQKYSLSLLHKKNLSGKAREKPNRELYLFDLIALISSERASGITSLNHTTEHVIELHKRLALPASIFVFALLAIPLGIRKVRSASFASFSIGLVVILIYFALSLTFESLAKNGTINPVLAVWSSNIIFTLFGAYLFYKSAKDMPIKSLMLLDNAVGRITRTIKRTTRQC
jgi:lipopolysaccharide export system permease protein